MSRMEKVVLMTFADPMMGLFYECEPIYRKLETHFAGKIEFQYVMAGLVRDVIDFMTPEEREKTVRDPKNGIRSYCRRLADIYLREESISGMPIRMDGFHLFDEEHRSSWPLDIAYEAVKLIAPDKAERFLYRLLYATIAETRQTTKTEEQLRAAEQCGIDSEAFIEALNNGTAEKSFREDLEMTERMGIRSLPTYLLQYGENAVLIRSLIGYEGFVSAIRELTKGIVLPKAPAFTELSVMELIRKRHLVSLLELTEAFDLDNIEALWDILQRLQDQKRVCLKGSGRECFVFLNEKEPY